MTVENVTYISDLEPANPKGGDSIAQGDNHIRNTKLALRNTFPNIDGEVVTSDEELNLIQGLDRPITEIIQDGTDADDALSARVTKNETDIADHETRITKNEADIADHETRITKNEADIAQIEADISAGANDLSALQSQVNTNTQNISNNAAAIATKADKSYVDTQDAKKADKSYVDSELAKKADSADLAALEGQVNSNTGDIADLQVAVEKMAGGAMIKPVMQPTTAGVFELSPSAVSMNSNQRYSKTLPDNATANYTFPVPNGMVFCLEGIFISTNGVCRFQSGNTIIDGVDINQNTNSNMEWRDGEEHQWPGKGYPPMRVESSIVINGLYSSGSFSRLHISGFFVEA